MQHRYANCVCRELKMRKNYLAEPVSTIYLGGGTPSQLDAEDINGIFRTISECYGIEDANGECTEITMECNPDDITEEFCHNLDKLPVNRISMGVQTFNDSRLNFLHRRHTSEQIPLAVKRLQHSGIKNVSIDLIFGFPEETLEQWEEDINAALRLDVEHISAYALTYEEGTVLYDMLKSGKVKECDEEASLAMYESLTDKLRDNGYEHYEISNFAKPSFRSRHNSSYWKSVPYLGIGAAAHSYDGSSRQWNADNISIYMKEIERGNIPAEIEMLTDDMKFDDMVMTRLRTAEGISINEIQNSFGKEYLDFIMKESKKHLQNGLLCFCNDDRNIRLTRKGLFVSDAVMADLMHV